MSLRSPTDAPVIRILFLASNPDSTTPLYAGREVRRIRERLAVTVHRSAIEIVERWAVRPSDLQPVLIEVQPHIVHFSGHGNAEYELMLEGDDGSPRPVNKRILAELFRLRGADVRMVVLNACHSLQQAEAIAEHVDCAVGMRRGIGSEAAAEFSAALYHAIGSGDSIRRAFESAQLHLEVTGIPEHRTPQLVVRRDGVDMKRSLVRVVIDIKDGAPITVRSDVRGAPRGASLLDDEHRKVCEEEAIRALADDSIARPFSAPSGDHSEGSAPPEAPPTPSRRPATHAWLFALVIVPITVIASAFELWSVFIGAAVTGFAFFVRTMRRISVETDLSVSRSDRGDINERKIKITVSLDLL